MKNIQKFFGRTNQVYHFSLLDPDRSDINNTLRMAGKVFNEGTDAILIGGSDSLNSSIITETVKRVSKEIPCPILQIIRDSSEVTPYPDGIIVPLVLNSYDVSYAIGIALGSLHIIKQLGIPAIPIGYVLVGGASTASFVTKSIPLPETRPKIIRHIAIGAEGIGLKALYLEGGSGAKTPVSQEFIEQAKQSCNIPIIVGGGIRTPEQVRYAISAGANIIVTGSAIEEKGTIKGIIDETKRDTGKL